MVKKLPTMLTMPPPRFVKHSHCLKIRIFTNSRCTNAKNSIRKAFFSLQSNNVPNPTDVYIYIAHSYFKCSNGRLCEELFISRWRKVPESNTYYVSGAFVADAKRMDHVMSSHWRLVRVVFGRAKTSNNNADDKKVGTRSLFERANVIFGNNRLCW